MASNIDKVVQKTEHLLATDDSVLPSLKALITLLLSIIKLLSERLGMNSTNSTNSSKPPASDLNRKKKSRAKNKRPRGGQHGHTGSNLALVDEPDEIKFIKLAPRTLPQGDYTEDGYERRQQFDIRLSRHVTEYRAQVFVNEQSKRFVAGFPEAVRRATQYGASIKANVVYMSPFQLIPYERIQTHFEEQFGIPISARSLYHFNVDAYERLRLFSAIAKQQLRQGDVLPVDETGINVDGKRLW